MNAENGSEKVVNTIFSYLKETWSDYGVTAKNGIIAGKRDGSFAPAAQATRAEAAYRLYNLLLQ